MQLNANCVLCFGVFHSLCLFDVRRTLFVVRAHIRISTLGTSFIILPLFPRIFCRSQFSSAPFSQPFIHNTTHPPCSHSILQLLHNIWICIRTHQTSPHSRFLKKSCTHATHMAGPASRVAQHTFDSSPFFIGWHQTQLHTERARDLNVTTSLTKLPVHPQPPSPSKKTTITCHKKSSTSTLCAVEAVQTTQSVTAARWPFLTHTRAHACSGGGGIGAAVAAGSAAARGRDGSASGDVRGGQKKEMSHRLM